MGPPGLPGPPGYPGQKGEKGEKGDSVSVSLLSVLQNFLPGYSLYLLCNGGIKLMFIWLFVQYTWAIKKINPTKLPKYRAVLLF